MRYPHLKVCITRRLRHIACYFRCTIHCPVFVRSAVTYAVTVTVTPTSESSLSRAERRCRSEDPEILQPLRGSTYLRSEY